MRHKLSVFFVLLVLCIMPCASVYANDLDSLADGNSSSTEYSGSYSTDDSDSVITDYMHGYKYVNNEQMANAGKIASPITNFFGNVTGVIAILTVAAVGLITALDIAYIAIPPLRSILNPQAQATQGSPMGGMGLGGVGMVGGQSAQQAPEHGLRRRWVSDEAVQALTQASGQSAQASSPMGGMGLGIGGVGYGGMNGGQQTQPVSTKSVISTYLKKRVCFLILFGVCMTLLLSSLFTDSGINLALLLQKVMIKINGMVNNVQV